MVDLLSMSQLRDEDEMNSQEFMRLLQIPEKELKFRDEYELAFRLFDSESKGYLTYDDLVRVSV